MTKKQVAILGLIFLLLFSTVYIGCKSDPKPPVPPKPTSTKQEITAPAFDADSAFSYVKTQVDFGPRVPGTKQHKACGDWMVQTLKNFGASITEQNTSLKMFDGKIVPVRNIIASFQPEKKSRVLLCAHWDTRPFGDKDPNKSLWNKAIDGANDGASGVGVLIEIARQLQKQPTNSGIDLLFFDVEDSGTSEFTDDEKRDELNPGFISSWCLGSQYWGSQKHVPGYNPKFGILLDMVGAGDAQFNKEKYSMEIGTDIVNLVWNTASKLGYGELFPEVEVEGVIDDHFMVTKSGVRCIDIIDTRPQIATMGLGGYTFGSYHHTHNDNIGIIKKETLKGVGQTLLQVIYNQ